MGVVKFDMVILFEVEFIVIVDGCKFGFKVDLFDIYGIIKLIGVMWMVLMVCKYLYICFVIMSSGGIIGINGMDDLLFLKKIFFKYIGSMLMLIFGMMYSVEIGVKCYVDGLFNLKFESGYFYVSCVGFLMGFVVDQIIIDFFFGN